jgi:beta-fructofuranosidase
LITTKQKYHLEPNRGLLNDPNGLVYFKGKYYVFFQWNRFNKNHSYKEWGFFTSEDMINWELEGSALLPDQPYDICGVYSGCAYVIKDQMYLYYTGNNKIDNQRKSSQCLAVSNDGNTFLKKGIIIETPEGYTEHFRDPKVFKQNNSEYFMVVGAQRNTGKGAIALFTSLDGEKWEYSDVLAVSDKYEMIECPDMFKLGNNQILLFNPQERDNNADKSKYSFSAYKFVDFDEKCGIITQKKLDEDFLMLDYGFDFYAPQTFEDQKGRRILFAWMSKMESKQEELFSKNDSSVHCLTIPRELYVKKGKLYQSPVLELYKLLGGEIPINKKDTTIDINFIGRAFYLSLRDKASISKNLCIYFQDEIKIEYIHSEKKIRLLRKNWTTKKWEMKECLINSLESIEIWADNSSIELFINDGEKVLTSRFFPEHDDSKIIVTGLTKSTTTVVKRIKENTILK